MFVQFTDASSSVLVVSFVAPYFHFNDSFVFCARLLQLGLMEDEVHSAVETATAEAEVDLDHDDAAEVEKILQAATTTGKLIGRPFSSR